MTESKVKPTGFGGGRALDGQIMVGISIVDVGGRPVSFDVQGGFVNIIKGGGRRAPTEKPQGVCIAHIHTTVTHRVAKIIVPVRTMESMSFIGKETCPWNAHQGDDIVRQWAGGAHVPGGKFNHDVEVTDRGGQQSALTGRDLGGKHDFVRFVASEGLPGQVDIDPFLAHRYIR